MSADEQGLETEQAGGVVIRSFVQRVFRRGVKEEPISPIEIEEEAGSPSVIPVEPPPTPDANRCRVCQVGFEGRARARCLGCVMRVHRDVCSTYLGIGIKYEIGMCNFCCGKFQACLKKLEMVCEMQT